MSHTVILPALIFLSITGMIYTVGLVYTSRRRAADLRIEILKKQLGTPDPEESGDSELIRKTARSISRPFLPRSAAELAVLRNKLSAAGFPTSEAIPIFASLRMISLVVGGFLGATTKHLFHLPERTQTLVIALGIMAGLYFPLIVLRILIRRRQRRIVRSLPDALDLMVISIDVGQSMDTALHQIVDRMGESARDLCAEFRLFLSHLNMGVSRREALHYLGARTGVAELNSFTSVLAQADRFGSSIAESLRSLSESTRIRRRQQAEEQAQKTAVKLIFPLVLFIFPGIFVALVGPAAITLYRDFTGVP